jgi:hypothetical protein
MKLEMALKLNLRSYCTDLTHTYVYSVFNSDFQIRDTNIVLLSFDNTNALISQNTL